MRNRIKKVLLDTWNPTSEPGLWGWWDFSTIDGLFVVNTPATPVTADADRIGYVRDKSGLGRNLTTGTASRKGTYKTNIVSNLSANLAAGDADADALDTAVALPTSDSTILVAVKTPATITGGIAYGIVGANHSTNGGSKIYIATTGEMVGDCTPTTTPTVGPVVTTSTLYAIAFSIRGSVNPNRTLNVNNVLYTNNVANTAPDQIIRLGSTNNNNNANFWTGHIFEMIAYNPALSDTQVKKAINYLMHKWGIAS